MWSLEVIKEMNKQKPKPINEKTSTTEAEKVNQRLQEIKALLEEATRLLTQDS